MTSRASSAKPAKLRKPTPKTKTSKSVATKPKPKASAPKSKAAAPKSKAKSRSDATAKASKQKSLKSRGSGSVRANVGARRASASAHAERFDRSPYELSTMELGEAVALAKELLAAKPARTTPAIAEEAERVRAAFDRAKELRDDATEATAVLARPFDVAMDRAWATFVRRVQDYAELPAALHPDAIEATKVYAIVEDLSILKLNYLAEFAQIGSRLDSLKREGLLDQARVFAGAPFVDEVLRCHAVYGEAIGVMDAPAVETATPDRGNARLELIDAIGEYVVQTLATARAGNHDSWGVVTSALAPIIELRARQAEELLAQPPPRAPRAHPPISKDDR